MATSGDPVGAGLVSSLARPGGNITGMSLDAGPEIYAKRLGLLREAAAGITRVGAISRQGGQEQPWHKVLSAAAENLDITLVALREVVWVNPGTFGYDGTVRWPAACR